MNMYLKDFESLLVILGDLVCCHQLDVVAVTGVTHNVILCGENVREYLTKNDCLSATTATF